MAKDMGLSTLAEGIERPAEAIALHTMGWEFGQGYLFGKPSPSRFPPSDQ